MAAALDAGQSLVWVEGFETAVVDRIARRFAHLLPRDIEEYDPGCAWLAARGVFRVERRHRDVPTVVHWRVQH